MEANMPNDTEWTTTYLAEAAARKRAQDSMLAANKSVLVAALAVAGIRYVEIAYDGYGDSGAIENAVFCNADNAPLTCPDVTVDVLQMGRDADQPQCAAVPLREALDDFVYAALASQHSGWEINEGSYGQLRINLDEDRIALCHSSRDVHYTEIDVGEQG
jgi:hypothetical protein